MAPRDEAFRRFLRSSSIGYAITGLALLRRKRVDELWKRIDRRRKPPEDYWPALGVGYMATIAAVAYVASTDRRFAAKYATPLLVAKGVTTAMFVRGFVKTRRRSFALAAITDASLFAAMAGMRARQNRSRAVPSSRDNVYKLESA